MARYLKNRRKTEGREPGALVFLGKEKMSKSQIELFTYNRETSSSESLKALPEWQDREGDRVRWLNICGLQDTELIGESGRLFRLSPLALEDILNTDQRPKVMDEEGKLVIFIKEIEFDPREKHLMADHVTMVLGRGTLVTYQEMPGDPLPPCGTASGTTRESSGRRALTI